MAGKNYRRGYAAEIRCVDDLRKAGYWCERFYASKGTFDVLAIPNDGKLARLIQVKRSKENRVSIEAIENAYRDDIARMLEVPYNHGVIRCLWLWLDAQPAQGKKPAQKARWRKFVVGLWVKGVTPGTSDHLREVSD